MQQHESDSSPSPDTTTLSGKTTLVTGATGFIGTYLAKRLQQAGAHVTGLYREPATGSDLSGAGIELVQGDILDAQAMESLISRGFDYVFHLAAWLRGGSGREAPAVNVQATRRLAELREFNASSSPAVLPYMAHMVIAMWTNQHLYSLTTIPMAIVRSMQNPL
jgi:uncharacterized protein YbjT (DUF2867 family)